VVVPVSGYTRLNVCPPTSTFVEELRALPQGRRLLRASNPLPTWSVAHVRSLTSFSFSLRFTDPWEMLDFAKLACRLAESLGRSGVAGADFEDACAEAWSQSANANKVVARFRQSETDFDRARLHLAKGSGRPALSARFWELFGGLRRNQRRFAEAADALQCARAFWKQTMDKASLAGCLVCEAINYRYMAEPDKAVKCAQLAAHMLPADADPKVMYSAVHTFVACLIDAGRPTEAAECLLESEDLFDSQKDPLLEARRTWLRGELDVALGLSTAEIHFKKAVRAFAKHGMGYEQAQILLQLALLYASTNRDRDLVDTIDKIVPIFQTLGIRREAMMARLLLRVPRQRRELQRATLLRIFLFIRSSAPPPRRPGV
jgi:tetratricopeptide (TPR) repeat protein